MFGTCFIYTPFHIGSSFCSWPFFAAYFSPQPKTKFRRAWWTTSACSSPCAAEPSALPSSRRQHQRKPIRILTDAARTHINTHPAALTKAKKPECRKSNLLLLFFFLFFLVTGNQWQFSVIVKGLFHFCHSCVHMLVLKQDNLITKVSAGHAVFNHLILSSMYESDEENVHLLCHRDDLVWSTSVIQAERSADICRRNQGWNMLKQTYCLLIHAFRDISYNPYLSLLLTYQHRAVLQPVVSLTSCLLQT